jgi:hypothetical protein
MSKKGDDDTFIMPGAGGGSGTRATNRHTHSLPTEILPPGRTGMAPTAPPGSFVDPFETVLMPTARRQGPAPGAEGPPMTQAPTNPQSPETTVLRPDQMVGPSTSPQTKPINPIVGILVITGGPGKGSCCHLYYGNNSIGRDANQSVRLDFGDTSISAQEQAFIRYDYEDRKFLFIPNLSKTNVVALNTEKPTSAVELKAWDEIRIGQTRLRFMPVCGPHFDWGDVVNQ